MSVFTPERVAERFELGSPHGDLDFVARGQSNALGVCRLHTDLGFFAVKRFVSPPMSAALAIEAAAYQAGVAMPRPINTRQGAPCVRLSDAGQFVWVRVHKWIDGNALDWGHVSAEDSFEIGQFMASVHGLPMKDAFLSEEDAPIRTCISLDEWSALARSAEKQQLVGEHVPTKNSVALGTSRLPLSNSNRRRATCSKSARSSSA